LHIAEVFKQLGQLQHPKAVFDPPERALDIFSGASYLLKEVLEQRMRNVLVVRL
jgi:hypothetical protein